MTISTSEIKEQGRQLGFDTVGVTTTAHLAVDQERMLSRIAAGLTAGLDWFTSERAAGCCDLRHRFPWVKSVISVALPYWTRGSGWETRHALGKVARYAWVGDYHDVVRKKLAAFAGWLRDQQPNVMVRGYVDTGPIAERAFAVQSGVGWFGKHTNVLTQRHGSWVFLAELLTGLDLHPDQPLRRSCGHCSVCLEACPTGALTAPYVLDNARCISFLTIEARGIIPLELRSKIGNMVFGCDVCQEVCPVNLHGTNRDTVRQPHVTTPLLNRWQAADPVGLLTMDEDQYRVSCAGSSLRRAHRVGLQRNAAVVLGNLGLPETVPALVNALETCEPLVRQHCAWALGRINSGKARFALQRRLSFESDTAVREEIELALGDE